MLSCPHPQPCWAMVLALLPSSSQASSCRSPMAWLSPLASLGLRIGDSLPPLLVLGGSVPWWALSPALTSVNRHSLGTLQWEPVSVTLCYLHILPDHLIRKVALGMLHNLTVPQFPSPAKCFLRAVDISKRLEEPLAHRKPYISIAIIFMISVSLCKSSLKTLKLG